VPWNEKNYVGTKFWAISTLLACGSMDPKLAESSELSIGLLTQTIAHHPWVEMIKILRTIKGTDESSMAKPTATMFVGNSNII
jgi:hypothetical protein